MKNKRFIAAMLPLLFGPLGLDHDIVNSLGGLPMPKAKKKKRQFTDEELAYVRSLPKKEKAKAVAELKAKYAKAKNE